ncbi:MAG: DUF3386 family protein [Gloeomargarita sp. SKYBB_i_bin120]|nr:DUF3386 domain-containing protein [Gloeomargarita sp. SKYB120]MDW8178083.1 DUF3386 family protein [Gloeomargarita sp. SKYBB_i_bin120]
MQTMVPAQDFFRAAYEHRYTWGPEFPGYQAQVQYQGSLGSATGEVTVDKNLKYTVTGIADEAIRKWVEQQMWEIITHLGRRPFEKEHDGHVFHYGAVQPDGSQEVLVQVGDVTNRYHLKDNHITMVYRHLGPHTIEIHVEEFHETPEGSMAKTYWATVPGMRFQFWDEHGQVGDYWTVTRRRSVQEQNGTRQEHELTFNNLALLQGV